MHYEAKLFQSQCPFISVELEPEQPNLVPAPSQESLEVGIRKAQRDGIDIGMEIDKIGFFQILVHNDFDVFFLIVDQAERRDRSGFQAQVPAEPLG